jgi:hypothetical protein
MALAVPRPAAPRFTAIAPAALAVGLAALAGHLASGVQGGGEASETISAGGVHMVAPEGWRVEREAAARAPGGQGLAVVRSLPGVVFARELAPAAPDAVRLGELEAYRWRGDRTTLAAPTSEGVAVVECSGPARGVRQCERAAATLETRGAPTSLDTLGFYASHLRIAIDRLERRREAARRADPAVAATRAGGAYESAARSLGDLAPPPAAADANEALVEALGEVRAAYGELGRAARLRRRPAYAAAGREVERREEALRAALAGMAPPAP